MTTVGIHAPGAMGVALGRCLVAGGHDVLTTAAGRSPATAERLAAAGLADAGSLDAVLGSSDVVLSVVPPGQARAAADELAAATVRARTAPLLVEANAVSPATVVQIDAAVPGDLVDAGISGPPPAPDAAQPTRVFVAGDRRDELTDLVVPGVRWVPLEGGVGAASAAKMCTASVRKGHQALLAHALLTADHHGVLDTVLADLRIDFPAAGPGPVGTAASKAWRFVDEMTEIADTQEGAGLTRALFDALAEVYAELPEHVREFGRPDVRIHSHGA